MSSLLIRIADFVIQSDHVSKQNSKFGQLITFWKNIFNNNNLIWNLLEAYTCLFDARKIKGIFLSVVFALKMWARMESRLDKNGASYKNLIMSLNKKEAMIKIHNEIRKGRRREQEKKKIIQTNKLFHLIDVLKTTEKKHFVVWILEIFMS